MVSRFLGLVLNLVQNTGALTNSLRSTVFWVVWSFTILQSFPKRTGLMTTKSMFNPHLFMLKHQIPTVHHLSFVRQVVIANQVGTQLNGFPWRKGGVRMSLCW